MSKSDELYYSLIIVLFLMWCKWIRIFLSKLLGLYICLKVLLSDSGVVNINNCRRGVGVYKVFKLVIFDSCDGILFDKLLKFKFL